MVGILLRLPAAADISQAQLVLFEAALTEPSLAGFGAAMEYVVLALAKQRSSSPHIDIRTAGANKSNGDTKRVPL